ncbi:MAG: FHIPEP family type III secretion protein [Hydrogenophaga sp.]
MLKNVRLNLGGDVGMVLTIVAVLSLMVFPLPPLAIDALLAINMAVSVLLLSVTIYMPNAVALTSFPSLLLFTTLFRLGLNVASTKSILMHANAGDIILAFGELVVGGNLAVGIVVFLVITIVQFIVIAKGSERVAEVGARFTLDAMPGKQMSIDADLRAGYITGDEARARRAALAMESQLHGGMDGAMKFVKGDAIAGLIITGINLVAGIAVGIMYHQMEAGEAANLFAILSIGDAMVGQIPSLLICVAAGVLITRVNDEHAPKPKSLGQEIMAQLGSNHKALFTAALMLLGFAAVPGFPWMVFLVLALSLGGAGIFLLKLGAVGRDADVLKALMREGARGEAHGIGSQATAMACPLALVMSEDLGKSVDRIGLNEAFEDERAKLQDELGLPFPGIRLWTQPDMGESSYRVLIHDVPMAGGKVEAGKAKGPRSEDKEGQEHQSGEQCMAAHAVRLLRDNAHQFLGIQEVQWVLERVGKDYPGLVAEVQKVLPLQRISEVLKRLLEEHVSIRNLRAIFESLVVWGPKEKDVVMLTEYVRADLGSYLTHRATQGADSLAVVLLSPNLERQIRESIKPTPAGNFLAMPPDVMANIAHLICNVTGDQPRDGLAVVTSMDIRRYVRRIVEARVRWLHVYSFQELSGRVTLNPVGQVTL